MQVNELKKPKNECIGGRNIRMTASCLGLLSNKAISHDIVPSCAVRKICLLICIVTV